MKIYKLVVLFFALNLLTACSSTVGVFVPSVNNTQPAVYSQGQPTLKSKKVSAVSVTVVEQSAQQAFLKIDLENSSSKTIPFTPSDITIHLTSKDKDYEEVKAFSYEELLAQGDGSLAYDGASLITSSASSVVPGGIITSTIGRMIGLGISQRKKANVNKQLDITTIKESYLRRHTLPASTSYSGVIKLELPRSPKDTDLLEIKIVLGDDIHVFEYLFQQTN